LSGFSLRLVVVGRQVLSRRLQLRRVSDASLGTFFFDLSCIH
jgi:hypothetical protein